MCLSQMLGPNSMTELDCFTCITRYVLDNSKGVPDNSYLKLGLCWQPCISKDDEYYIIDVSGVSVPWTRTQREKSYPRKRSMEELQGL